MNPRTNTTLPALSLSGSISLGGRPAEPDAPVDAVFEPKRPPADPDICPTCRGSGGVEELDSASDEPVDVPCPDCQSGPALDRAALARLRSIADGQKPNEWAPLTVGYAQGILGMLERAESDLTEMGAVLEWTGAVLAAQDVDDFAQDYPTVRQAHAVMAQLQAAHEALDQLGAPRTGTADAQPYDLSLAGRVLAVQDRVDQARAVFAELRTWAQRQIAHTGGDGGLTLRRLADKGLAALPAAEGSLQP